MSQKVVVAEYYAPEAIFKIPKGIDLKDKTIVEDWYVHYQTLCIKFVDKDKVQEIEASFESQKYYPDPEKATIMDRKEYEDFLSSDDDEDDDDNCAACGTTCLDHTSNKGRGSESPCLKCGENRCKYCPCECSK